MSTCRTYSQISLDNTLAVAWIDFEAAERTQLSPFGNDRQRRRRKKQKQIRQFKHLHNVLI